MRLEHLYKKEFVNPFLTDILCMCRRFFHQRRVHNNKYSTKSNICPSPNTKCDALLYKKKKNEITIQYIPKRDRTIKPSHMYQRIVVFLLYLYLLVQNTMTCYCLVLCCNIYQQWIEMLLFFLFFHSILCCFLSLFLKKHRKYITRTSNWYFYKRQQH